MAEGLCNGFRAEAQRSRERKGFSIAGIFECSASLCFRASQLLDLRASILSRNLSATVFAFFLLSSTTQAATITVTTTADDPVGDMPGECSLRAAVASANDGDSHDGCASGSTGTDDVMFDPALSGEVIVLSEGELNITNALTISGPVPGESAGIKIDGDNQSRIFNIQGNQKTPFDFDLTGVTLTGGRTSGEYEPGGAIYAVFVDLNLEHVLIVGNSTEGYGSFGGGMAVEAGNVIMTSSRVSENATRNIAAGGGGMSVSGDLELAGSVVSHNSTVSASGGGIYAGGGDAIIAGSDIFGNSVTGDHAQGGGVYFWGGGKLFPVTSIALINSSVSGNSTEGEMADGGGFYNLCGEATLIGSTISGNSVGGLWSSGAGMYVSGGGIKYSCGNTKLTNSTISGNSATGEQTYGGGLAIFGSSTSLTHVTMAYNTAANSDGLFFSRSFASSRIDIYNSLFVQAGEEDVACDLQTEFVEVSNILATDDSCLGDVASVSSIAIRPLANNGGITQTHALNENSDAINAAGDCQKSLDVDEDQRGLSRPGLESSACDIGAYEFQNETIFHDRFGQIEACAALLSACEVVSDQSHFLAYTHEHA